MAYGYSDTAMDERLKKIRGDVYQAQTQPQALPEYDYARRKATETANTTNQSEQDALKRRFAAMGALNSGSSIKAMQIQTDAAEQRKADALEGINVQEAAAKRAFDQQQQQMAFQSGEAAKQRLFGAEESGLGREFQSGEALKGREFQSGEALKGREFQSGESALSRALQEKQFQTQLAQQNEQFSKQYDQSKYEFEKNYGLALEDLHKKDILEKFLDNFGVPGIINPVKGAVDKVGSWIGNIF